MKMGLQKGKQFMNMNKKIVLLLIVCTIIGMSCGRATNSTVISPVDYVNPYMGNISHLLVPTYPTMHLPNSMLRIYPERADYTSDLINGLPVVVTSHRGSSAFNISPVHDRKQKLKPVVTYSYDNEKITPYGYTVYLDDENIHIYYALSHQSAIYTFQFLPGTEKQLLINTRNGKLNLTKEGLEGYQIIENGEASAKVYLYLETEEMPQSRGVLTDLGEINYTCENIVGKNKAVVLSFSNENHQVSLRYGISFISVEQAKRNLRREIEDYNIDHIAQKGKEIWNNTLSKIAISGGTKDEQILFYTSLYRTYERMINISEDGYYFSAFDNKVHSDNGIPFYTDDWIWDTYRATHPLRVLIEPEMETAMVHSYIRMAQQSPEGWMPTFPEITGDSYRMNGNHAVAVVLDAYVKGLTEFDLDAAYNACRGAIRDKSLLPWTKQKLTELDHFYWEKGYFPALHPDEKENCAVVHPFERRQAISVTLGNSYDNWCLAEIARLLHKRDDYKYFLEKSYNYRSVFNASTQFFHPRDKKGNFIHPFDYRFAGGQGARAYYGENNAWIYRWDVQHNIHDLIELMNGRQQFIDNLNATFREPLGRGKSSFYAQLPDHTGNVGQFSMANEPCLHIPYLYNYAGQPWMTQKRVRTLIGQWFRNDLMGMPGDEDGGGMSAFVVFSMMGLYPVTPGTTIYNIGSPMFENVKMDLANGKIFEIIAYNASWENKYIQSAILNGKEWEKPWFSHDDIIEGGVLELVMGNKANKLWGVESGQAPPPAVDKISYIK